MLLRVCLLLSLLFTWLTPYCWGEGPEPGNTALYPVYGNSETYGIGWLSDPYAPTKNDIYTYLHKLDTDDDGDIDSLDSSLGGGDVSGPASSVNNNVVFFDGTTGKQIKDSGVTLSGSNTGDEIWGNHSVTELSDVTAAGSGSIISTAERNKLSGIEAGATADQNATEILVAIKTVDGTGSGLDSDLVDGQNPGTSFTRDAEDVMTDGSNLPDGHAIIAYGDANWNSSGNNTLWTQTGGNIYRETGNVGIGTITPNAKLDIADSTGIKVRTNTSSVGVTVMDRASQPGKQLVVQGNEGSNTYLNIATSGADIGTESDSGLSLWTVDIDNCANATEFNVKFDKTYGPVIFTHKFGTGAQGDKPISLQSAWGVSYPPTQLVLNTDGSITMASSASPGQVAINGPVDPIGADLSVYDYYQDGGALKIFSSNSTLSVQIGGVALNVVNSRSLYGYSDELITRTFGLYASNGNFFCTGNAAIGKSIAQEALDVNGAVRIGTTSDTNAGTIRWTGSDFEGYTGTAWSSLTSGAGGAGGSNTQIQFNDSGVFNGDADFTWTKTTNNLGLANAEIESRDSAAGDFTLDSSPAFGAWGGWTYRAANVIHVQQAQVLPTDGSSHYFIDGLEINHYDTDTTNYETSGTQHEMHAVNIDMDGLISSEQFKDQIGLSIRARGRQGWDARGTSAITTDTQQFGTGIASNEFHVKNLAASEGGYGQSTSMAGLQLVMYPNYADEDSSHVYRGLMIDTFGKRLTHGIYIASHSNSFGPGHMKYGINMKDAIVETGAGIVMPQSAANNVGTVIEYDTNDYSLYDRSGDAFKFVIGGDVKASLTASRLYVNGAVTVGTTSGTDAGTIRWTGADFQGYDGSSWLSLTSSVSALKVAIIGDSLSQPDFFRDTWSSQFSKLCNEMGFPVEVKNYAVCGDRFYDADHDHTEHESHTRSQVEQAIAQGANFVFVMLGINDAILVGGRSTSEIISDAQTVYNDLHAGLPNATIVYVEEYPHNGSSLSPSSLINDQVIPHSQKLITYKGLSNCRVNNSTFANTTIDSTELAKYQSWGTASSSIRGIFDAYTTVNLWKILRMGAAIDQTGHLDSFGQMMVAHYVLRWFKDHNGIDNNILNVDIWTNTEKALMDPDSLYDEVMAQTQLGAEVGRHIGIEDLLARSGCWFYGQRFWRPYIGPKNLDNARYPVSIIMRHCQPNRAIYFSWNGANLSDTGKTTGPHGNFYHTWAGPELSTDPAYDWSPGTKDLSYAVQLEDGTYDVYNVPIVLTETPHKTHIRLRRNSAQSIPNNQYTTVMWDYVEYDTLGEYNSSNGRFSPIESGYYRISGGVCSDPVTWPAGMHWTVSLNKNGSSAYAYGNVGIADATINTIKSSYIDTTVYLNPGDYITLEIYQDQGGSVNVRSDSIHQNYLTIDRLPL